MSGRTAHALSGPTAKNALLPQDLILRHGDKIFPFPYENMSAREFRDTFIEEGELYLQSDGALALPFSIDPLLMYWNRDIFTSAGIANPPEFWDEFLTLAPTLTVKDEALNIRKSAVALGEARNILHSKDILSMIMIQAGTPIVRAGEEGLRVVLNERGGFMTPPSESALRFYTGFSNPVKPIYSWNRALPDSRDFFASGDLAVYFGYASEHGILRTQSPHLNFDVALVPQIRESNTKKTFGKMFALASIRRSPNLQTALHASFVLSQKGAVRTFSEKSLLPPVRRDLLSEKTKGFLGEILFTSALISQGWFDPSPQETDKIFGTMIENVTSGRATIQEAVSRAHGEIERILRVKGSFGGLNLV